ncbi:hypothetical protein EIP86_002207 [Pleurotus ostreatoroseus]|nr:hypothetical protein EIP86_002207 [Pleurotus ostreatoroseus]
MRKDSFKRHVKGCIKKQKGILRSGISTLYNDQDLTVNVVNEIETSSTSMRSDVAAEVASKEEFKGCELTPSQDGMAVHPVQFRGPVYFAGDEAFTNRVEDHTLSTPTPTGQPNLIVPRNTLAYHLGVPTFKLDEGAAEVSPRRQSEKNNYPAVVYTTPVGEHAWSPTAEYVATPFSMCVPCPDFYTKHVSVVGLLIHNMAGRILHHRISLP